MLADYVVVSIHAHEGGANRTIPADFIIEFAHAVIDAGADGSVNHRPCEVGLYRRWVSWGRRSSGL